MSNIMVNTNNDDEPIKCRYCSSTKITTGEKGFSIGQASAGFLTLGILGGFLAGNIGRKDIQPVFLVAINGILFILFTKKNMKERTGPRTRNRASRKFMIIRLS